MIVTLLDYISDSGASIALDPDGAESGDVLIAAVIHDNASSVLTPVEGGWTPGPAGASGSTGIDHYGAIFTRQLSSAAPESYGFEGGASGEDYKGILIRVQLEGETLDDIDVGGFIMTLSEQSGTSPELDGPGEGVTSSALIAIYSCDSAFTISAGPSGMSSLGGGNESSSSLFAYSALDPEDDPITRPVTWSAVDAQVNWLILVTATSASGPSAALTRIGTRKFNDII